MRRVHLIAFVLVLTFDANATLREKIDELCARMLGARSANTQEEVRLAFKVGIFVNQSIVSMLKYLNIEDAPLIARCEQNIEKVIQFAHTHGITEEVALKAREEADEIIMSEANHWLEAPESRNTFVKIHIRTIREANHSISRTAPELADDSVIDEIERHLSIVFPAK